LSSRRPTALELGAHVPNRFVRKLHWVSDSAAGSFARRLAVASCQSPH
jgi:hypothetical protein